MHLYILVLKHFVIGLISAISLAASPIFAQPKEIRVNDVTLNYIEQGQGDPVVFVHGTLGDYRT